ncbi:uncharacterized protein BJX67DRAFT_347277 [Aspergillus lucknowensis]|uniref:Uncharacterized protein n=1 Tax=Aspergillus lucknowensis TaxID=176173 RepID=A0ABR4LZE2_9EURO
MPRNTASAITTSARALVDCPRPQGVRMKLRREFGDAFNSIESAERLKPNGVLVDSILRQAL